MLYQPESLVHEFRRVGDQLTRRGLITNQEFIIYTFHLFAHTDKVDVDLIPELWQAVPAAVCDDFAAAMREAAKSEFRWRSFYVGGRLSEEEEQRGTVQIRAWVIEFSRFLDNVTDSVREDTNRAR